MGLLRNRSQVQKKPAGLSRQAQVVASGSIIELAIRISERI
jgi:hypothetical protein